MPRKTVNTLIVFGDSLSDIGRKRSTWMGRAGRLLGKMRVNEIGRFSDGRNWTDYLWEWSGGLKIVTKDKSTTNNNSQKATSILTSPASAGPVLYANYAVGGAMGASDISQTGLTTFEEQKDEYLKDRKNKTLHHDILFLVWFGLNDLVTNTKRSAAQMEDVANQIINNINEIKRKTGDGGTQQFVVFNLPSPAEATRFLKLGDLEKAKEYDNGAKLFNKKISELAKQYPEYITVLDIAEFSSDVANHPEGFGLKRSSQPHGMKVDYNQSGISGDQLYVTTSDDAHPTEAVYRLLASFIAHELVEKYKVGKLKNVVSSGKLPAIYEKV